MFPTLIALFGLSAWIYLIAFRGGFWRLTEHDRRFAPEGAAPASNAHVIAIVPARDEAEVIAKFHDVAGPAIDKGRRERIAAAALSFDRAATAKDLTATLGA